MDGKEIYQKTSMLINYSKFGADSWQNIYENEKKTTTEDILQYISSRSNSQRSRKKRNSLSGKKGVMYVSLDAGGGGERSRRKRKTVTAMDVVYALKRQGMTLYGFGG